MDGNDPRFPSRRLRSVTSDPQVAAFDLTFSAPKSVSVLFAIADEPTSARAGRGARERGAAALEYLAGRGGVRPPRQGRPACSSTLAGWSRRRTGIGCRGRLIRSCTRTWSRRISREGRTWPLDGAASSVAVHARADGRLPVRGAPAGRGARAAGARVGPGRARGSPSSTPSSRTSARQFSPPAAEMLAAAADRSRS